MSMQLNLKADCEKYTDDFENYAKVKPSTYLLIAKHKHELLQEIGDDHYRAIAKRNRLDYEEWMWAALDEGPMTGAQRIKRQQKTLNQTKEYLAFASKSTDLHIRKDALKRMANMYVEISQGAPPFGAAEDEVFATTAELELLGDLEIEDNEKSDLYWLRKFSRARAVYFVKKMREVGL